MKGYTLDVQDGSGYDKSNVQYSGSAIAEGTNPGTYMMGLDANKFSNSDPNYEVIFALAEDGRLDIIRKGTIDPDEDDSDKEKEYKDRYTDPEKGNGSGGKTTGSHSTAATGDDQNIIPMIILAMAAMAALIYLGIRRRRDDK